MDLLTRAQHPLLDEQAKREGVDTGADHASDPPTDPETQPDEMAAP